MGRITLGTINLDAPISHPLLSLWLQAGAHLRRILMGLIHAAAYLGEPTICFSDAALNMQLDYRGGPGQVLRK